MWKDVRAFSRSSLDGVNGGGFWWRDFWAWRMASVVETGGLIGGFLGLVLGSEDEILEMKGS